MRVVLQFEPPEGEDFLRVVRIIVQVWTLLKERDPNAKLTITYRENP